jgi:peptidoglycan/LPS O-acetylase OafA/YrhL
MDALLMGVGLAFAFRSEAIAKYIHGNKALVWSVFLVLLAGMGDLTFRRRGYVFFDPFALAMLAMFYASFISLAIVYRGSSITAILRSNFLMRLGMYSYGLYMYHQMVSGLMHGYFRNASPAMNSTYGVMLTLISLPVTAVIAILSYHTFEAYFLRLGRRFKYDGGSNKNCTEVADWPVPDGPDGDSNPATR